MPGSRIHALLIGIDRYCHQGEPALGLYGDLEGAALDVERWSTFLEERGVPAEHLCRLIEPSYERMVEALEEVSRRARPGDDILFAFSGHGGCVPTVLPDLKGEEGIDEALIPAGTHRSEARVLRDVELAVVLQRWAERGLRVTLCLDCCHAGGVSRQLRARGTGRLAPIRPAVGGLADLETLRQVWRTATRRRRDLEPASGWLPDPRGYVLFAACRAHERAYEGRFDAQGPGGALTHALLETLRAAPEGVSCAQLHRQVEAKVRNWTEGQNPQLEGERGRSFWKTQRALLEDKSRRDHPVEALLRDGDPGHYLQGQLSLTVHSAPQDFAPREEDRATLRRSLAHQDPLTGPVPEGRWICLKVENLSRQPLFVALYVRLPDGTRKRIYPTAGVGEADLLRAGSWDLLPLQPSLPPGCQETMDTVEAIAANESRLFEGDTSEGLYWTVARLDIRVVAP